LLNDPKCTAIREIGGKYLALSSVAVVKFKLQFGEAGFIARHEDQIVSCGRELDRELSAES
jgi:hypothetical protein